MDWIFVGTGILWAVLSLVIFLALWYDRARSYQPLSSRPRRVFVAWGAIASLLGVFDIVIGFLLPKSA